MSEQEYADLGKYVIEHLNKLMSGEHQGTAVILPIRTKNGGMTRLTVDMPVAVDLSLGKFYHYIWVPDSQAFVLDEYVYKEKNK